jgi:hypothetical protein
MCSLEPRYFFLRGLKFDPRNAGRRATPHTRTAALLSRGARRLQRCLAACMDCPLAITTWGQPGEGRSGVTDSPAKKQVRGDRSRLTNRKRQSNLCVYDGQESREKCMLTQAE